MLGNKGTGREYRDGGCRGGQDQFKWEDVKADAYRESYLGHSVNAPVGRWQKGKDILWYTKKHGEAKEHVTSQLKRPSNDAVRRAEIAAVKEMEEDMLNQELGLATKKRRVGEVQLDKEEIAQLLVRGESTREGTDIERVEGLGAAPSKRHDHVPKLSPEEQELVRIEHAENEQTLTGHYGPGSSHSAGPGSSSMHARSDDRSKERKREEKRAKKERKREKKARKKEKKSRKKEAKKSSDKKESNSKKESNRSDSGGSSSSDSD